MEYEEVEALRDALLARGQETMADNLEAVSVNVPIVALGVGGTPGQYVLAVRVPAITEENRPYLEWLTEQAGGAIDIRETGRIRGLQFPRGKVRPLLIGSSCANEFSQKGTLGCFVRRLGDPRVFALSNNHVFARLNLASPTERVEQPGATDQPGSVPPFAVGNYETCVPLNVFGNKVDAAIAAVNGVPHDARSLTGFPRPLSPPPAARPKPGDVVHKIGRTTGFRTGRISAAGFKNVVVTIDNRLFGFDDQMEIESGAQPFSDDGDSGSIVFDDNGAAVGLLFSGNTVSFSYANPIDTVFSLLHLSLA